LNCGKLIRRGSLTCACLRRGSRISGVVPFAEDALFESRHYGEGIGKAKNSLPNGSWAPEESYSESLGRRRDYLDLHVLHRSLTSRLHGNVAALHSAAILL
jgi:hypothetical protein